MEPPGSASNGVVHMARNFYQAEPNLICQTVVGPNSPAVTWTSTVPVMTRQSSNTTVKRSRPANLLANPTPHGALERQLVEGVGRTNKYGSTAPVRTYAAIACNASVLGSEYQAAERRAAAKLRSVMKDQTWNAATTFAELGKTLQFFIETAGYLRHSYRLARSGDVFGLSELYRQYDYKGGRRKPAYKRVANVWLQWRYAIRPLAFDLRDMLQEFHNSNVKPIVFTAKGRAVETYGYVVSQNYPLGAEMGPATLIRSGTVEVCYSAKYSITPEAASWKRLGLWNVPALLWELTPFSFVVDWFLPVGDYLNNLDAAAACELVPSSAFRSTKYSMNEFASFGGGVSNGKLTQYSRELSAIPNQPKPSWQRPKGDLPSKAVDAFALLAQAVKPRR
ncbi:MAG: maturation protein [Sanya fiers-like virus 10]|nr:MAG: maturation protein [Sanya fiers-like virus 10]UUW21240.1 MAG: maturation protein [Sanya fiers-like virus 10]